MAEIAVSLPALPQGPPGPGAILRRLKPSEIDSQVYAIRQLLARDHLTDAGKRVDRLMNACAGIPHPDANLVYAEYCLGRGRPFSALSALAPLRLARPDSQRAQLLEILAHAELGDPQRAREELAAFGQTETSGPLSLDVIQSLGPAQETARSRAADGYTERLCEAFGLERSDPFGFPALRLVDEGCNELGVEAGKVFPPPVLAFWIGEFCRRHLGGVWLWRRNLADSTLVVPLDGHGLEVCPLVWAHWRLARVRHRLTDFIGVLLVAKRNPDAESEWGLGGKLEHFRTPYRPDWGRHALSEALHWAYQRLQEGGNIIGLGLLADSPLGRVEVPALEMGQAGPELSLFWSTPEDLDGFRRYADALCLGPFARLPWRIRALANPLPGDLAGYQTPDLLLRAVGVARRLVSRESALNARWAASLAAALLQTLDGSLASLRTVDDIVMEARVGGKDRWGELFDDRLALLFLLTCYCGEVLLAHCGGRWGADRLTGLPLGPTSGLERGDMRFNLGAKLLLRFYQGGDETLDRAAERFVTEHEPSSASELTSLVP